MNEMLKNCYKPEIALKCSKNALKNAINFLYKNYIKYIDAFHKFFITNFL